MATIQGIYIALFGRPADPLGLAYFNEETNNGADLTAIGDLSATDEYQDRFAGLNNVQIVTRIYQELFGRDPDAAGLAFFVAQLNAGTQNINTIAINILDGAQGNDLLVVNNKIAAANLFTAEIDTAIEVGSYVGDDAADAGRDFLDGVTADPATIPTQAEAADAVQDIVDDGVAGNTLTPAAGTSVVVGDGPTNSTNNNDVINISGDYDAALGSINGGLGYDTVNTALAGGVITLTASDLQNIERFNVQANGGATATTLNLAAVVGLQSFGVLGTTAGAEALTVTGLDAAVDVRLLGGTDAAFGDITFEFDDVAGTADARTITLENDVDQSGDVNVLGVENITLDVEGPGRLANINFDDAETVTITGTGDLVIGNITVATDATIDASAHVGKVTIGNGTLFPENDVTVIGGASNDTFIIADNSEGITLTGNAGSDLFNIGALTNLDTITDVEIADDLISITDFNGAQDVLDVLLTGSRDVFNNVENANVSGAADLGAALAAAGNATSINSYSVFQFEGNTYVYQNDGTVGLSSGDGVVELVGFTGELTASNFI